MHSHTLKTIILTVIATLTILSNICPDRLSSVYYIHNPLCITSWGIGTVLNEEKDGIEEAPYTDSYYNYISYRRVECEKGDKILTIFIYRPLTHYNDDIIKRIDFNLGK
jgi:hypothetical protein